MMGETEERRARKGERERESERGMTKLFTGIKDQPKQNDSSHTLTLFALLMKTRSMNPSMCVCVCVSDPVPPSLL